MKVAVVLALGASLLACSGEARGGLELSVRVECDASDVELGRAFGLVVVLRWHQDLVPDAFDDGALAPLVVERLAVERSEHGGDVEEVRRYRARVFAPGRCVVAPVAVRAQRRGGGVPASAASAEVVLDVRSALADGDAAAPEGPGDLLPLPASRLPWWWVLAAVAGLGTVAAFATARRRAARASGAQQLAPQPAAPAGPSPAAVALQRLDALAAAAAQSGEAAAFVTALAAVVRDHSAVWLGRPTATSTSEELLAACTRRRDAAVHVVPLSRVLSFCDLVKFAAAAPPPPERQKALAAARAFVQGTAETA